MNKRNVADMTERELNAIIFEGAGVYTLRGPSDAFTPEEIQAIMDAPHFAKFTPHFQSWMYSAWESQLFGHKFDLA